LALFIDIKSFINDEYITLKKKKQLLLLGLK